MKRRLTSLLLMMVAGCDRPAEPVTTAAAAAPEPAQLELGRKVYNYRCYFCHGYSGDARTLAATFLSPPPRDFTRTNSAELPVAAIERAVHDGRPGTAMKPFGGILSAAETLAVAAFVADEFIARKAPNTAYHTLENGWPDHARFSAAFPFATGAIALDAEWESLTAQQAQGRRIFMSSCVSCHDRARVADEGPAWSSRPVSYPRFGFAPGGAPGDVDAVSGASPYAKHDIVPTIANLTRDEQRGQRLYQDNCAFCHAADGTGANWIGRFMQPPARDLTTFAPEVMPRPRLVTTIRDGLDGTSMPAWRNVLRPEEIDAIAAYVTRAFMRAPAQATPAAVAGAPPT